MTRRSLLHALAGLTATALVALAIVAQPATGATANLVADPGFESGLSNWTCSAAAAVGSPTHSGSGAAAGTPAGQNFAQCSQQISVQPNSQYSLSAWVQGSYVYLGATGTGTTDPQTWTSSSAWQQLTTSFTTGAATSSVTIYVHGWYGQGTFYADDFNLLSRKLPGAVLHDPAAAAEQVQPDRPDSKPGLAARLAVAPVAGWATMANETRAVAVRPAKA